MAWPAVLCWAGGVLQLRAVGSPLVGAGPIVEMLEDAELASAPHLRELDCEAGRRFSVPRGRIVLGPRVLQGSVAREVSATGEAFGSRSSCSLTETPPGGPQTIRRLSASRCRSPKTETRRISDSSDARVFLLRLRAFRWSLHFFKVCSINWG